MHTGARVRKQNYMYLIEFAKTLVKKFQVHLTNLTSKSNVKKTVKSH